MATKIRNTRFSGLLVLLTLFVAPATISAQDTEVTMQGWKCIERIPGIWKKIKLDGGTQCGQGHEYWFWVRCGTVNKLVIFFQGGGFAYNAASCENFIQEGHTTPTVKDRLPDGGIFNFKSSDNPFKDYNFVLLPYCSGDFHWGNRDASYNCPQPSPTIFQHRGFVNARAALQWVFENYPKPGGPSFVLITGSSAGGLGSIFHAPYIIKQYPRAKVSHLSDSGAGIVPSTSTIWSELNGKWGITQNVPWLTDLFNSGFELSKMYVAIATQYPANMFSQFNFTNDSTQLANFVKQGGREPDFRRQLEASLARIHASVPNFRSFTVPGMVESASDNHCILSKGQFYKLEARVNLGGKEHVIRFRDWVYQIAEDPEGTPNVYVNHVP